MSTDKELQPHQQRVVTEAKELNVKIEALGNFLLSDLFKNKVDSAEQDRLVKQYAYMCAYWNVLNDRIAAF